MTEYDTDSAIKMMRQSIPDEASRIYDNDQLLNLIDIIWDYYELNGLLEIDLEDENEDTEDIVSEITDYAIRMLKKDKGAIISPEHVETLVRAELRYEDSLLTDI